MTTATLTISERYEVGRSDGYADGAHCAQWTPQLVHDALATFPGWLRIAREQRQAAAYFSAKYPERYNSARAWQAYNVGFCRGFREAVQGLSRGEETMTTTTPNYWEMEDSKLAEEWRKVDAENYANDYSGEKAEHLNMVEDAVLQRIGAPDDASGDELRWQEKIRAFGEATPAPTSPLRT